MPRDRTPTSLFPVAVAAGLACLAIAGVMFNLLHAGSTKTKEQARMITELAAEKDGVTVLPSANDYVAAH